MYAHAQALEFICLPINPNKNHINHKKIFKLNMYRYAMGNRFFFKLFYIFTGFELLPLYITMVDKFLNYTDIPTITIKRKKSNTNKCFWEQKTVNCI